MLTGIFTVPNEKLEKLGLGVSRMPIKKGNCFKVIFDEAKKRANKTTLSIQDITAGYYELFTSKHPDLKLKTKKSITNAVGLYSGISNIRILTRVGCGMYKLYEPEDDNNSNYIKLLPKKRGYYRKKDRK